MINTACYTPRQTGTLYALHCARWVSLTPLDIDASSLVRLVIRFLNKCMYNLFHINRRGGPIIFANVIHDSRIEKSQLYSVR